MVLVVDCLYESQLKALIAEDNGINYIVIINGIAYDVSLMEFVLVSMIDSEIVDPITAPNPCYFDAVGNYIASAADQWNVILEDNDCPLAESANYEDIIPLFVNKDVDLNAVGIQANGVMVTVIGCVTEPDPTEVTKYWQGVLSGLC